MVVVTFPTPTFTSTLRRACETLAPIDFPNRIVFISIPILSYPLTWNRITSKENQTTYLMYFIYCYAHRHSRAMPKCSQYFFRITIPYRSDANIVLAAVLRRTNRKIGIVSHFMIICLHTKAEVEVRIWCSFHKIHAHRTQNGKTERGLFFGQKCSYIY